MADTIQYLYMTISALKNRLRLPIIAAPMFLVSGPELVIACCQNGIVGSFPSLNGRTAADFEFMLQTIQQSLADYESATGQQAAPYAVNLIVNKTNTRLMEDLQLCVKYKVPIIITSLGAVKEIVDAVHAYGGLIFHDVIKKRHAEKAAEAGVDGIICVSAGAGGHAGTAHPFALVEEVKSFYKGAIILSGSINTGKEVLAAEIIGADFAYMGTRFIATDESMADADYIQMIINGGIDDIIYTDKVSGVPANFIKQSIALAGLEHTADGAPDFSSEKHDEAKAWKNIKSAGHGVCGIKECKAVSDLVQEIAADYNAAKRAVCGD